MFVTPRAGVSVGYSWRLIFFSRERGVSGRVFELKPPFKETSGNVVVAGSSLSERPRVSSVRFAVNRSRRMLHSGYAKRKPNTRGLYSNLSVDVQRALTSCAAGWRAAAVRRTRRRRPGGALRRRRRDARRDLGRHGLGARTARPHQRVRRVYGSSAGAINAAYFLAGQAAVGTTIYYEDINNSRFINPWRGDRTAGRSSTSASSSTTWRFAASRSTSPACWPRRRRSRSWPPTPRPAAARSCETSRRARDLLDAMRAGATMPIVAGHPAAFGAGRYFDASLTEPIPVPTAEAEGHTHILVLLTRPGVMRNAAVVVRPVVRRAAAAQAVAGTCHAVHESRRAVFGAHQLPRRRQGPARAGRRACASARRSSFRSWSAAARC